MQCGTRCCTPGTNTGSTTAKDHSSDTTSYRAKHDPARRVSTETKSSYKITELIAYIAAVVGVLIASALVDASDFGAQEAWFYVTLLTIGLHGVPWSREVR